MKIRCSCLLDVFDINLYNIFRYFCDNCLFGVVFENVEDLDYMVKELDSVGGI